jgi:hypothetical protein
MSSPVPPVPTPPPVPYDWTVTAKKVLYDALKVGAVAAAAGAAALPDSFWGQVLASAHLSPQLVLVATMVGIPALRGFLNAFKNRTGSPAQ